MRAVISAGPHWRTRRGARLIAVAVAGALIAGQLLAAPPDVKSLFPAGLQQGTSRTLKVSGKPGTTPVRAWCDQAAITIVPNDSGAELTVTVPAEVLPGQYWIRLFNDEGASPLLPLIVGVTPETTETELAEAEPELPVTISGVLAKSGEVDTVSFSLEKGQTFIASVDAHRSLGAPADMVLQLVSEDGFVIDQNDDFHGFDPQLVYTAKQSGKYVVRLFAFPAEPNSTIRFAGGSDYAYRLTLTTGPFSDHSVPLSLPEEESPGPRYVGWNIPDDDQDTSTPAESIPASFDINRIPRSSLSVVTESSLAQTDSLRTASVNSAVTGHIAQPAETDAYLFEAAKDQRLRVSVAARSVGSPLDPVLRVVDAGGKLIKESDDISRENVDVQLDLRIPAAGNYRAEITDRYGHGGMRYVYELRIEEEHPRFVLSVKEDRYTLKDGKPLEIPVTIERQGGFTKEIKVAVSGLPEGVAAEPVVSAAKGDTAKQVTLTLKPSTSEGFQGSIRIIGRGPDGAEVAATTSTPLAGITTSDIWLTVPPAPEGDDDKPAAP